MAIDLGGELKKSISPANDGLAGALGTIRQTRVFGVDSKVNVSKAEEDLLSTKALTVESDPFAMSQREGRPNTITPTYNPTQLALLRQMNNTLAQCVAAMETNIDGTGYDIERKDKAEVSENDSTVKMLRGFFDECYPTVSFLKIRKKLRVDLETTGNAYLEVLRGANNEIVFVNHLDAKLMRMVELDDAVLVTKEIERGGKNLTVKMYTREKRYIMVIGKKFRYFKEYGSSRRLDMTNGLWENTQAGQPPIPDEKLASEVIHFKVDDDVSTLYGVPRWINQIPSTLGSRKAEEYNLNFFNHGGIPPAMILLQGGQMTPASREALTAYLSGAATNKQRAIVIEIFSNTGDLGTAGNVKATVERFGAERQQDAMFEKYDEKCSTRIRSSFRLPPLFVGLAQDYNYATAVASYQVAEAQVFAPERTEFDSVINATIMKELAPDYVFRSKPMSVQDITVQLQALGLVKEFANKEEMVEEVNELCNLHVKYEEPPEPKMVPAGMKVLKSAGHIEKSSDTFLIDLAADWANFLSGDTSFEPNSVSTMKKAIDSLAGPVRKVFNNYVAMKMLGPQNMDPDGVTELMSCSADCAHGELQAKTK